MIQLKTKCRRRSNLSRCQLHDCININIKRLGTPTAPHHSLNLAWPLFPFYLVLAWPSIFGQLLPLFASPRFRVGEVAPYMLGLLFWNFYGKQTQQPQNLCFVYHKHGKTRDLTSIKRRSNVPQSMLKLGCRNISGMRKRRFRAHEEVQQRCKQ